MYPLGLKFWINDVKLQITEIQNSNIKQSEREKNVWEKIEKEGFTSYSKTLVKTPVEDCYDHTETFTKGPLLKTILRLIDLSF